VNIFCAADYGKVGHSITISYQLSSQKCLVDGWTVWPLARPSLRRENVDTHSLCDEMFELDQPLYKVNVSLALVFVTNWCGPVVQWLGR